MKNKSRPFNFDNRFEFNLLNIENYNLSSRLSNMVNFIKTNRNIKGDYFEFGVFQGSSLLSIAILFKKLKINKMVYGFDTFSGFPKYHENDDINNFKDLYLKKKITKDHYEKVLLSLKIKKFIQRNKKVKIHARNISSSLNFSNNSYKDLNSKIKKLGLNNIKLIKGDFTKTLEIFFEKNKNKSIFASNIDCDLYLSYKKILPLLWNKINKNGLIMLDEYYSLKFPGAKIACDEFFEMNKIKPKVSKIKSGDFERWYIKK